MPKLSEEEISEETLREHILRLNEYLLEWINAWFFIQNSPGMKVYIADDGVELRKFGIRLWAPDVVAAVDLARREGWTTGSEIPPAKYPHK